jgi:hypothetical protein
MNQSTQNKDDDAELLAGFPASSLVRRSGQPVIQVFSQRPAAQRAAEEAISPDWEVPPTIGEMAVRLLAEWSLPRMKMLGPSGRRDDPSAEEPIWEG